MSVVVASIVSNGHIVPRSHSVFVDRRSGDGFARVTGSPMVQPGEAIRYSASGLESSVTFQVFNASGMKVFEKNANKNFVGNAWVDTVAPITPGFYLLRAKARNLFLGGFLSLFTHDAELTFEVSKDAPKPPSGPPGFHFPDFDDVKTLAYIGAGIVGLVAVASVVTNLSKR